MEFYLIQARQFTCAPSSVCHLSDFFKPLHTRAFTTAPKLEHILHKSIDFHNVLSRSSSERHWDTILGRQEAGQDDLCHFSFSICATATNTDLAPGIQSAEIKTLPHSSSEGIS